MGAMAESMLAYAQPLLDDTDGSVEQMNFALDIAMVCYNLALLPDEVREDQIIKYKATME